MKKTLIALAVVAVSGTAFAQSTVNLTGVVGFGLQKSTNSTNSSNPATALIQGADQKGFTNTDATFALSVSEDLGGGMRANAAIQYDATASTFGQAPLRRNTSIGLTGGFGSVSLMNTRSGDLITRGMVAPSNLPDGMYDGSGVVARVPVDVLTYGMAFGAVQPYIQYVEWNTDGNTTPAYKTTVLGANYSSGPLAVGVAFKATSGLPAGSRKNNLEAFATYDFGVARVGFGFDGKTNTHLGQGILADDAAKNAFSLGVAAPMGALTLGANFAKRNDNKVTEVVAKYDLSKRTHVNASFGKQSVDNAAGLGSGTQYRIGVYHAF